MLLKTDEPNPVGVLRLAVVVPHQRLMDRLGYIIKAVIYAFDLNGSFWVMCSAIIKLRQNGRNGP